MRLMSILKTGGMIGAVALVGVLIAAATGSDTFRVQRSASIKAEPDRIFPLINDLHRFNGWNPFERKDPNLKRSYSGAPNGKGAIYAWEGNDKIGQGRMDITDSVTPSKVVLRLEFMKPMKAVKWPGSLYSSADSIVSLHAER